MCCLKAVWKNDPPKRFIPRSLDGGSGWGVFDRQRDRFLSNKEVKRIGPDDLSTEMVLS
jgi:hypothetical protein